MREMVDECLNLYEGKITSEEDETLFNNLKSDIAKYEELIDTAQTYVAENKLDEAEAIIMGEAAEVGNSIQSTFEELFAYNVENAKIKNEQNLAQQESSVLPDADHCSGWRRSGCFVGIDYLKNDQPSDEKNG